MGCGESKSTATENQGQNQSSGTSGTAKPAIHSSETNQFTDEQLGALKHHNECRKLHGCEPMTLNAELCKMAQEYAQKLLDENKFEHSSREESSLNGNSVGENLYWSEGMPEPYGTKATQSWYDEIALVDWNNVTFIKGTGHFTQVVWKGSKEFGIGIAIKGDKAVVVGRYLPAGNMMGAFDENVTRLL